MALINCPECGKEISSTVKKCPNCGYTVKKKSSKKIIGIILIIVLILGIGGIVGYKMLIPQKQYSQAVQLLEQGKCNEANDIFSEIQDYKDVKELQEQAYYESIVYDCIDKYKEELERPDSLEFKGITFYQGTKDLTFDMTGMEQRFEDYKERSEVHPICLMRAVHETNTGITIEVNAQFFYDKEIGDYKYSGEYLEDSFNDEQYLDSIEKTVNWVYYESSIMLNKYFDTVGTINENRVKQAINNNQFSTDIITK